MADPGLVSLTAPKLPDDLAVVKDEDTVSQCHDFFQCRRDQQHRSPGGARIEDALVDKLDRADIDAPRGLGTDKKSRVTDKFTGDDQLLLISPRQTGGHLLLVGGTHIKGFDGCGQSAGSSTDLG